MFQEILSRSLALKGHIVWRVPDPATALDYTSVTSQGAPRSPTASLVLQDTGATPRVTKKHSVTINN